MMNRTTKRAAIRLLLVLAVVGVAIGGASGSAAACNHWFDPPEDEPDYCNDSLTHEFLHLTDIPVVTLFAVALIGSLFVLGRR